MHLLRSAVVVLVLVAAAAPAAARRPYRLRALPPADRAAGHVVTLRVGPFDVPAGRDREVCQYVELPWAKLPRACDGDDCALALVGWDLRMHGGTSHHFILWAYEGTTEGADAIPPGLHERPACIGLGPTGGLETRQIGGSQTRRARVRLPDGLGIPVRPVRDAAGRPRGIGLLLNSHYLGIGVPTRGRVTIRLHVARPARLRATAKLIFDPVAGAFIDVPPGAVRTTSAAWEVGGADVPLAPPSPTGDACVFFLTSHMHQRGTRFTTDLVTSAGTQRLYDSRDWAEPAELRLGRPLLMTRGMRLRYECTHDNGVERPQRLGCEVEPGVTPGIPQWRAFVNGGLDGSARHCRTDADCDGIGTGRCVPANLVFGFTGDDEMCILPGLYYDAVPGAPAGRECDLSLLPRSRDHAGPAQGQEFTSG
jgi:hypothetical protein